MIYIVWCYPLFLFYLIVRLPPISTRTYTHFPYTTLFRSYRAFPRRLARSARARKDARGVTRAGGGMRRGRAGTSNQPTPIYLDYQATTRSEEHTSELPSLMRISYAVVCLKKIKNTKRNKTITKSH